MGDNYTVNHLGRYDLDTGVQYDMNGNVVEPGLGESTKEALLEQLKPRQATLVGNIADLQVLGVQAAQDSGAAGVVLPDARQGVVETPAQREGVQTAQVEAPTAAELVSKPAAETQPAPASEAAGGGK